MKSKWMIFVLVSLIILMNQRVFAQDWTGMMDNPNANFYQVTEKFYESWNGNSEQKGRGYKQFKRWEYFWAPRVYPSGNFPARNIVWMESEKYASLTRNKSLTGSGGNWNFLGPDYWTLGNSGYAPGIGRVNCISIDPNNSSTYYIGTPAGGVWKSMDAGGSWINLTDNQAVLGASSILINPSNSNEIYVASGDGDGGDTYSVGILKSSDGGSTWNTTSTSFAVDDSWKVYRMIMDPTNPSKMMAATNGGVLLTTNGWDSYLTVLSGVYYDIEWKPGDPSTVYVCGKQLYKSTDGGTSFTEITSGLPSAGVRRLAIGVTEANSSYVYVIAGNDSDYGLAGIYQSTNSASSFTLQADSPNVLGYDVDGMDSGGQCWYDLCISVSQTDENVVFTGGVNVWKSTNGGIDWTINCHWIYQTDPAKYVHADIHNLDFIDGMFFASTDGGIFKSSNVGTSWVDLSDGLNITQYYNLDGLQSDAGFIYAGAQDNGISKISAGVHISVKGGDGMECLIDPNNNDIAYVCNQNGSLYKTTDGGANFEHIAGTDYATGAGAWVTPLEMDPQYSSTIYGGYAEMYKSTDGGSSWSAISSIGAGSEFTHMKVAASNSNYIYVATDDNIWMTSNGGTSWSNIALGLPTTSAAISSIGIHSTDQNKVWVTFSGYTAGEKIYESVNGGTSWSNISGTLPNLPANCVIYENGSADGIYIGMDVGVYYRDDNLSDWESFMTNLPNVIVKDFHIHYGSSKIRAATFGRGIWESELYSVNSVSPPTPNFSASPTSGCVGLNVQFTDQSSGSPTSWSWSFVGGDPVSSTNKNPVVTYNAAGSYTVVLTATNVNGSNTITKVDFITVGNGSALPITENFESAFPAAGWELINGDGLITWAQASDNSGNKAIYLDNFDYDAAGQEDKLITEAIDLSATSNPTLEFKVSYVPYSSGNDGLKVLISTDCGASFETTALYDKSGSVLATGSVISSEWTPTNAEDWRLESIDLSAYSSYSSVVFAFVAVADYGNNLWLDDINIAGATGVTPPVCNFSASPTELCSGNSVSFSDQSTNSPTSWSWTFPGGSPSSSSLQNPTVSYSSDGVYDVTLVASNSGGSNSLAKTGYITVGSGMETPTTENFEGTFPPAGWTITNDDADMTWQQVTDGSGNKSGYLNNYNYNAEDQEDYLITPALDLTLLSSPELSFYVSYSQYNLDYIDGLKVLISTDCGNNFSSVPIYEKEGTELASAVPNESEWIPNGLIDWRKEVVSLASYSSYSSLMIAFVAICGYGNNVYVDDIVISETQSVATFKEEDIITFFPNPTSGELFIRLREGVTQFEIIDLAGKTLIEFMSRPGEKEVHPTISTLAAGTYFLKAISKNGCSIHKLQKL